MSSSPYTLKYSIAKEHDLCFYEVKRNETETPFTVVVEKFSQVGHKQFFEDIFVSREWDRDREASESTDLEFLHKAWKHYGLEKTFSPPTTINTERRAYVYRKPLEDVIKRLGGDEEEGGSDESSY